MTLTRNYYWARKSNRKVWMTISLTEFLSAKILLSKSSRKKNISHTKTSFHAKLHQVVLMASSHVMTIAIVQVDFYRFFLRLLTNEEWKKESITAHQIWFFKPAAATSNILHHVNSRLLGAWQRHKLCHALVHVAANLADKKKLTQNLLQEHTTIINAYLAPNDYSRQLIFRLVYVMYY